MRARTHIRCFLPCTAPITIHRRGSLFSYSEIIAVPWILVNDRPRNFSFRPVVAPATYVPANFVRRLRLLRPRVKLINMPFVKLINALFRTIEREKEKKRPRMELINREREAGEASARRKEKKKSIVEHFDETAFVFPIYTYRN